MSKELTPLEALEIIKKSYENAVIWNDMPIYECPDPKLYVENLSVIKTIENALKDYETCKMYSCDEFREFVYKNDFKSVKNIELAFNSLIKRNNKLEKENEKLSKQRYVIFTRTHQQKEMFINEICKSYKEIKVGSLEDDKKLKALEIIKKEIRGCLEFYYDEEHDYGEVWCVQNEEENRVLIASANSKEEYELLKEVLL